MSSTNLSRRELIRLGVIGAGTVALPSLVTACSSSDDAAAPTTTRRAGSAGDVSADVPGGDLLAAAQREKELNLIAISDAPESAYGPLVDKFRDFSDLEVHLAEPLASSGMELDAVRAGKGKATQPDVVDIGMSYATEAAGDGLLARSIPDGWTDVPSAIKDADGLWVSSYYGLVGIVANPALLGGAEPPATLDDLRKLPDGVKMGFPGDPRSESSGPLASAVAFAAVWTVALANGGSFDDIGPGIDYFADLAADGTFDPAALGISETVANGGVAVTMLNNFDFARTAASMKAADAEAAPEMRIIAAEQRYPSFYAQCAVAGSPHPDAGKLWLAYLLSVQGAKAFLAGGAVPTRFPTLYRDGSITDADLGKVGDLGVTAADLAALTVPIPAQAEAAQKLVNERWGPDVMGDGS